MKARMLGRNRGAPPRSALAFLMCLGLVAGCSQRGSTSLFVGAASSLVATLRAPARAFEEEHPGVRVELIGDSSSRLARQLEDGAPYDIFISARADLVRALHQAELVNQPATLAVTGLALADERVTPRGEAPTVRGLITHATAIGVADPSVPLGARTEQWLAASQDAAGLSSHVHALEANALAVERRLTAGEIDLAVLFTHQCASLPRRFRCLPIDAAPVLYRGAVNAQSTSPVLAAAFLSDLRDALPRRGVEVRP